LLFEEELIVIAPHDHPLAAVDRVSLAQLSEHHLLLEPPGTAFRDDLDAQAREAGVMLTTKAEVDGMRLVASLAFEGFGAAVLPASAAPNEYLGSGRWKIVRVDGLTRRSVGLVRRRRGLPSAPARALTEALRRTISEQTAHQQGIHGS
jgi:DNA-binding transcriptional LysR family regulator